LLIVIAIIGILAALLLSAVSSAKNRAQRIVCLNNLCQINLGVRMYSDDANDKAPGASRPYVGYKELMKNYLGLRGKSSQQDKIFACPADTFYFDYWMGPHIPLQGYVAESVCAQSGSDFSSYVFNGGNLFGTNNRPGIAGLSLSSIKHPTRTIMVTEAPALVPFSWHAPKWPLYVISPRCCPNAVFNDAMDMVSFVDGHVSYIKMYYKDPILACLTNPPAGYDYQWSPD
jgi:hypothetical protein